MAVLSLRLISVFICVVLTLVTAVLTLSVSLSFSKQAVSNVGHQYAAALGSNLHLELQSILQQEVDQYFGFAALYLQKPLTLPSTNWQWWNGSYWTFNNQSQLDFLLPYQDQLMQLQMSQNFSRELNSGMCFADGTYVRVSTFDSGLPSQAWIPKGPNPYDSSIVMATLTAGKPDRSPFNNTPQGFSYIVARTYYVINGSEYTPAPISPEKVSYPAPWALPPSKCDPTFACTPLDCRQRPYYQVTRTLGPRQCAWYPLFVPQRATIATGVSCAIYNNMGQYMGAAMSLATVETVSYVVQHTRRTAHSHAFIVNVADETLLGSTYAEPFSSFWLYGNATYVSSKGVLVNNSLNPITVPPGFDGATFMNATYLVPKKNCLVGTTSTALFIGCYKTVSMYGYAPLKALRDTVGLGSAVARQGTIRSGGENYYYAMEPLVTYADNQVVPGLQWTSIVFTPESEVTGDVGKGRSYSIVATVCFFAFAALCCYMLFSALLQPLERLGSQMEAAAKFCETDEDQDLSAVGEVRNMQVSFCKLREQLGKLKSFVPQSVLATLQTDTEGEVDEEPLAIASVVELEERSKCSSNLSASNISRPYELPTALSNLSGTKQPSSGHSRRESQLVRAADPNARLNLTMGLTKRTVSIVIFNVVGLHAVMKDRTSEELQNLHTKLLEAFNSTVVRAKGVVDSFQGDRFVATFNAVTPNVQHAARAAVAATELILMFQRIRGGLTRATIGVATGDAQVGNCGTESLRRFCTIGRVFTQATVMERLAKQHLDADILVTPSTAAAVSHVFYVEALDCVSLEGCSRPVVVHALRSPKTHETEEWNYAMATTESQDEFLKANEAWKKFAEGDVLGAKHLLPPEGAVRRPGAERLRAVLTRDESLDTYLASTQGYFYKISFAAGRQGPTQACD